nr:hypothetical protein [Candidatus Sigynarchaeota archaeon]
NIKAQRINATGDEQWTPGGVPVFISTTCSAVDIVSISDGQGGVIIAWRDERAGTQDIYAQRVNASGQVKWTANGVSICNAVKDQSRPSLESDGTGGAIIVWEDNRNSNLDIYAQHVTATGAYQWGANGTPVCNISPSSQVKPIISRCGNNHWAIAWEDGRVDYDIYAQILDINHNNYLAPNGVPACNETGMQSNVVIKSWGENVIMAWEDTRNGNGDIYVQRLSASATMAWPNGTAVVVNAGEQNNPCFDVDSSGNMYFAWRDQRGGVDEDIYFQKLYPNGTRAYEESGVPVTVHTGNQFLYKMASDGASGAFLGYVGPNNNGADTYFVQHVLDNLAPEVTSPSDANARVGETAYMSWTATDASVNATTAYSVKINGTQYATGSWTPGAYFNVQVNTSATGVFEYMVLVSDGYGGQATDTVIITILPADNGAVIAIVVICAVGGGIMLLWFLDKKGIINLKPFIGKIRDLFMKQKRE